MRGVGVQGVVGEPGDAGVVGCGDAGGDAGSRAGITACGGQVEGLAVEGSIAAADEGRREGRGEVGQLGQAGAMR